MIPILNFFLILASFTVISCSKEDEEEPTEPATDIREIYDDTAKRAVSEFLDHSRIVSRDKNGQPSNVGDSLIFSGLALYGLPCDLGTPIEAQIISEIGSLKGGLMRHPLEPNEASLDGALGLYFGIADRISRCGSSAVWKPAIDLHMAFVDGNHQRLNPKSDSVLTKEFDYVLHLLGNKLGLRSKPTDDVKLLMGLESAEWARACMVAKKSCFRIHLGLLALKTVEMLGENIPKSVKWDFCDVTRESQMPTVDHWCERGDLKKWIDDFKFDVWEYRHQRCGYFETPDANGNRTPAIDYLVAVRTAYEV